MAPSRDETEELDMEMEMQMPMISRSNASNNTNSKKHNISFPGALKKVAYRFDGRGNFFHKEWDLSDGEGSEFCWYHVELPRTNNKLSIAAQYLIDVLCPPLKLHDILSLVSNGPFCANVDGALVFRVNSAGPTVSKFTHRLAARITEHSLITVSLGKVPRLGFSSASKSLLSEIPSVDLEQNEEMGNRGSGNRKGILIREHVLEFLLTMNHSEEADNPVPSRLSNLIVHIVDTHVDHLQDMVTQLEMELDAIEIELDKGSYLLKKQLLDDRRFPKMHLNLQRLLQVIAHGEQVFPRVKDKCVLKSWFSREDVGALDVLVDRLRRLKENVGFLVNRVTAIQAGLDSWQAEQINKKLYYLSFLSMIFLPLSIVTGIFGMNVGGVPWTNQTDPEISDGFRNVLILSVVIVLLLLLFFGAVPCFMLVNGWRRRLLGKKIWSSGRRWSFTKRGTYSGRVQNGGYLLL